MRCKSLLTRRRAWRLGCISLTQSGKFRRDIRGGFGCGASGKQECRAFRRRQPRDTPRGAEAVIARLGFGSVLYLAACGIVVFVVWTRGERTTAIAISVAGVLVWLLGRVLRYFFSGKFSKTRQIRELREIGAPCHPAR